MPDNVVFPIKRAVFSFYKTTKAADLRKRFEIIRLKWVYLY